MTCTCNTIGNPPQFRKCPDHYRFWFGDKRLVGVGSVVNAILPTDWSKIPEAVLENARDRGEWVDRHFCRYLALKPGESFLTDPARAEDRFDYLNRLITWWERSGMKATVTQEAVFSEHDGVVGILDLRCDKAIFDLKCTSSLAASYKLQLGGYTDYAPYGKAEGIIHVTKKDVRLVPYKSEECYGKWRTAVEFWKLKQEMQSNEVSEDSV